MGTRGVSPVVGYALLVGIAAVLALSVFAVGATVIDGANSAAKTEQAEAAMTQFADTASTVGSGASESGAFELTGDERATTWVNESAGHVQIEIVNGTDRTEVASGSLGAYRQRLDDGTELGYQGGGVFRKEHGHVKPVEPPAFEYRQRPEPTLSFPNVRIRGDSVDSGEVRGELAVANETERTLDVENPVTGDYAYVEIDSRYCQGWETHVRDRTDGLVEESCDEAGTHTDLEELRVNLSVPDEYVNESVNRTTEPGEPGPPDPEINHTYGLYAEEEVVIEGAGGTINGSIGAGENVEFSDDTGFDHRGETTENVSHEREPHDDRIQELLNETDPDDAEELCSTGDPGGIWDCEYGPGTYRISDFNGGGGEVTFDVSDGDVILVVPGDMETSGPTEWTVIGHEDGGSVQVYVQGDVTFGGSNRMGTTPGPGPDGMDDPVSEAPEQANAEALQFLATSDTEIDLGNAYFSVEGMISAPSAGVNATSQAFRTGSAHFEFIGAMHAGRVELESASSDIYQDSDVATTEYNESTPGPDPTTDVTINRTVTHPDTDLYYLHVSETVVEVED